MNLNDRLKTGALDGVTDEFNVGTGTAQFNLLAGVTPLAELLLANPAFLPATMNGAQAQAVSGTITKDTTVTPGTIDTFQLTDRDLAVLLDGTVGLTGSGADFIVSDNVIPVGATEVSSTGLTLTLALA